MRDIDHFVAGAAYASGGRHGEVFDPNNGGVQAGPRRGLAGSGGDQPDSHHCGWVGEA